MGSKEQPFLTEDSPWLKLLETEPFIPKVLYHGGKIPVSGEVHRGILY